MAHGPDAARRLCGVATGEKAHSERGPTSVIVRTTVTTGAPMQFNGAVTLRSCLESAFSQGGTTVTAFLEQLAGEPVDARTPAPRDDRGKYTELPGCRRGTSLAPALSGPAGQKLDAAVRGC